MPDEKNQPNVAIQKSYDDTIKMVNPPTINADCMALAREWIDKNSETYRWSSARAFPEYTAAVGALLGTKVSKWLEECEKDPDAYIKHYTNEQLMDERMREVCSVENPDVPRTACNEWGDSRRR